MNPRDLNQIVSSVFNATPEQLAKWFATAPTEDINLVASVLEQLAVAKMIASEFADELDEEFDQYPEANEVLRKFTLQ